MGRNKLLLNQRKVGTILHWMCVVLNALLSILIVPLILRKIGKPEYGIYNLAISSIAYLNLLSYGLTAAFIHFHMKYKVEQDYESEQKLNTTFLILFLCLSLFALILGLALIFSTDLLFGKTHDAAQIIKLKKGMGIAIIYTVLYFPLSIFGLYMSANERFIAYRTMELCGALFSKLGELVVVLVGGLSLEIIAITTGSKVILLLATLFYSVKNLDIKFSKKMLDKTFIKNFFKFSAYIFIMHIVMVLNLNINKMVLGSLLGPDDVAVYSHGAMFTVYILNMSDAIVAVLRPHIHKMVAEKAPDDEFDKLMIKTARLQFMVIFLFISGFIFLGKPFINLLYGGPDYKDSYYIGIVLLIFLIIPAIQNSCIEIQRAKNKHRFTAFVYVIMFLVGLGISVLCTMKIGLIGSVIGAACYFFIGDGIILNIYYHKKVNLNMKKFWLEIFKLLLSLLPAMIFGFICLFVIPITRKWVFVVCVFGYAILYCLSLYLIGMNKYEKGLIHNFINKVFRIMKKGKSKKEEEPLADEGMVVAEVKNNTDVDVTSQEQDDMLESADIANDVDNDNVEDLDVLENMNGETE